MVQYIEDGNFDLVSPAEVSHDLRYSSVSRLSPSLYLLSMRTRAAQGYSPGSASLPPITFSTSIACRSPHTSQWLPKLSLVLEVGIVAGVGVVAGDGLLLLQVAA